MSIEASAKGAERLPLEGVVVIDLTHIYNGPYATFLMAMAGATVVKVEPRNGEHLRHRADTTSAGAPFAMLNANKLAVTLDFTKERGHKLLIEMIKRADVIAENFAPGVLDRRDLGYKAARAANPRIVYASGSGYGLSGPNRDYPAMDLTVQAMSGVLATTGFEDSTPLKAGPAIADFSGGVHLYGAIVTALFQRERTGCGRMVEVSMQEATYAALSSSIGMYFSRPEGEAPKRTGNRHSGLAESPYNVYPTRDGYIAIVGNHDRHFRQILTLMERDDLFDDPRFLGLRARADNMDAVDQLVSEWTGKFDKEPLAEMLLKRRVPCAPVREIPEVVRDRHMHERGTLLWQDHPQFGRIVVQRSPMRYHGAPLAEVTPSGALGAHNHDVYVDWLGLDESEYRQLREAEVI